MMQKSSLSNYFLTNVRNLKVFLEVHSRDIDFAKTEQSYHLTSKDAEAAAVNLLLPLHRKRHIRHTPLHAYMFVCFVALRPKSTAMVIAGRSVHLTTLFPGQA